MNDVIKPLRVFAILAVGAPVTMFTLAMSILRQSLLKLAHHFDSKTATGLEKTDTKTY